MTIASEITKLNTNLSASYAAAEVKGATLPTNQNFDNLADTIGSISGESGSDTFEAQLLMENIVNSGTLETESNVVTQTVSALTTILGE